MIEKVLGKNGIVIWKKANGIDNTPVQQYSERKSLGTERTFQKDTIDIKKMNDILTGMVEKLCFELRSKQKLTSCITVKIRYSNFDTHTLQKQIPYTALDHTLIDVTKELFKKLYQRRMLIRLIGVRFSGLVHGGQQLDLFDDIPEQINLYEALDNIRSKYGVKSVGRARVVDIKRVYKKVNLSQAE
jgi:DNA polymerase-4